MTTDHSATGRFRAQVSERRQRIGEQILTSLVIAALSSAGASYLTGRKAVEDMKTELAVMRTEFTMRAAASSEQLGRLERTLDRISEVVYQPRRSVQP